MGSRFASLTHGQMAVIADNLSAIRSLADERTPGDLVMWRLRDYVNLQLFACLWGAVPGSVRDEASPFNECAHCLSRRRAGSTHASAADAGARPRGSGRARGQNRT